MVNVDIVKVISLVLVFITHSTFLETYPQVINLLQEYVLTSFMFLAGYMCQRSLVKREYKVAEFWKNKLKVFLVPFWLMVALWFVTKRQPFPPIPAYLAYAIGLNFLSFPPEWGLFSLWFASVLLVYYLIFSLMGKHKKLTATTVFLLVIGAITYFSSVSVSDWMLFTNFFFYIMPFAVGFFWSLDFSNRKMLLFTPALLLITIGLIEVPVSGNVGTFLWQSVNWLAQLVRSLAMVVVSLYMLSKVNNAKLSRFVTWVASGSLIIYLMEPIWSMWIGWLLFPQYIGNPGVQFLITPEQSVIRVLFTIPIAFLASPAIYRFYLIIVRSFPRRLTVWLSRRRAAERSDAALTC